MRSRIRTPLESHVSTAPPETPVGADDETLDFLDDEEIEVLAEADDAVEPITSDPLEVEATEAPIIDTEGLDAAPSEIPTRVGAGAAGDLTGVPEDEALASDEDGADGSDIVIDEGEEDPDQPKDLIDLMVESVGGEVDASKI